MQGRAHTVSALLNISPPAVDGTALVESMYALSHVHDDRSSVMHRANAFSFAPETFFDVILAAMGGGLSHGVPFSSGACDGSADSSTGEFVCSNSRRTSGLEETENVLQPVCVLAFAESG